MPGASASEQKRLAAVLDGDDAAARSLVEELYPLVMKIVRAHRPRRVDEEDLAQAVFLKMFAHLDQYAGRVPLAHWISRIAVNTCLNALRFERSRPELRRADLSTEEVEILERLESDSEAPSPAHQVATRDLVERLLETLSPTDRMLLTLLDLEGRSLADVRAVTGWNMTRIKVRAFRARRKLRRTCAALLVGEGPLRPYPRIGPTKKRAAVAPRTAR